MEGLSKASGRPLRKTLRKEIHARICGSPYIRTGQAREGRFLRSRDPAAAKGGSAPEVFEPAGISGHSAGGKASLLDEAGGPV